MDKLLEKGARDVFYTPIFMKKNRPAYKLSVLCKEGDIELMEDVIFKNTTSIGIRKCNLARTVLEREIILKETKYGKVRYKLSKGGDMEFYSPEYEDIKDICNKTGLGFKKVYNDLMKLWD